jgi:hypothetical protein
MKFITLISFAIFLTNCSMQNSFHSIYSTTQVIDGDYVRTVILKIKKDSSFSLKINEQITEGIAIIRGDTLFVSNCKIDDNEILYFIKLDSKSISARIDKTYNPNGGGLLLSKGKNGRPTF